MTGNTVIDALLAAVRRVREAPPDIPGLTATLGERNLPLVPQNPGPWRHAAEFLSRRVSSPCILVATHPISARSSQ